MILIERSNRLPVLAEEIKRAHTGVLDAAKTVYVRQGAPWHHVEWILGRPFRTVAEWLGDEGVAFRKQFDLREPSETFKQNWQTFLAENDTVTLAELEAEFAGHEQGEGAS